MKEGMSGTVPRVPFALGGYPAAAFRVGTLAAMPEAAIVNLDISSVSGPRAGVSVGGFTNFQLSTLNPELPGRLGIRHRNGVCSGFHAVEGVGIVINGGGAASPRNFPVEALIDGLSTFSNVFYRTVFFNRFSNARSAAFGPGSYLGFRSANGYSGRLEVTWPPTLMFEILSGAFEGVTGVGIEAGAVAAVPEPTGALGTLGLLPAGMFIRRRKRAA